MPIHSLCIIWRTEYKEYINNNSITDYLKKAEKRLSEEDARCEKYLHISSLPRIRKQCEQELIAKHVDIFNSEFKNLLNGIFFLLGILISYICSKQK